MAIQLSLNFWDYEFSCKCGCGAFNVDPRLVSILQRVRDKSKALVITSGVRCEKHNKEVGGAPRSWHIPRGSNGYASDFTYADGSRSPSAILKLYALADQAGAVGLGLYHGRVHIDVREGKRARWVDSSWDWKKD